MTELPELIEDPDGAPLPAELQRDGEVWRAVRRALDTAESWPPAFRDLRSDEIAQHLAPVLWPWLPSNDHGPIAERDRLIRIALDSPVRFTARIQVDGRPEPLWRWQTRAVGIVLDDPGRARAAL